MREQWKQDIETTHHNMIEASEIRPITKRIERYINRCKKEIDIYRALLGRDIAGRYIRSNMEARSIADDWLNFQGVVFE